MKTKKIPMRMCTGCREKRPKKELIRIVRPNDESPVRFDKTGKAPGRGAYICHNIDCLGKAVKTKALERALEIKIESDVYDFLKEELLREEQNQ